MALKNAVGMTDRVTQGFNPGDTNPIPRKCRRHDRWCNPGFQPWAVGKANPLPGNLQCASIGRTYATKLSLSFLPRNKFRGY